MSVCVCVCVFVHALVFACGGCNAGGLFLLNVTHLPPAFEGKFHRRHWPLIEQLIVGFRKSEDGSRDSRAFPVSNALLCCVLLAACFIFVG